MYPLNPVAFTGVSPGDAITATVTYNSTANTYHMNLTDVTTGAAVTSTQSCPKGSTCLNSSAEVISEDPGGAVASGVNLADFGMVNFTATRVTDLSGLSGTPLRVDRLDLLRHDHGRHQWHGDGNPVGPVRRPLVQRHLELGHLTAFDGLPQKERRWSPT